jgi:hypothetical protein
MRGEARERLCFGIYPGMTGDEVGVACLVPDDPTRTEAAILQLQPAGRPFLVRSYLLYHGPGRASTRSPADPARYATQGRALDLALCYRTPERDIEGWVRFVRSAIEAYGGCLGALQIAEEPNNPDAATGGDGGSPGVREAVVQGVLAAREEAERLGLELDVGFNATPSFRPDDQFWPGMAALCGPAFLDALDYVGLDFFPDVFRPVPHQALRSAVEGVITHFRRTNLAAGGIPSTVPIRITENGWPTGPGRSQERQAEVLEEVVRTVDGLRGPLNITHYELFLLRDADSDRPDMMHQFGLLRHDYSPKPAFEAYRRLIRELGA